MVITTVAIRRAKLPSNKPTSSFFTGRMPFLFPNQYYQNSEGKNRCVWLSAANRLISFRTQQFCTLALVQDAHVNMPLQAWELRPLAANHAQLHITAAVVQLEIQIKVQTRDGKEQPEPSKNEPNQNPGFPRTEPCKNPNRTESYHVKNRTEPEPRCHGSYSVLSQ